MILQSPIPSAETTELTEEILDNTLLVYAVWDHGDNGVHVASQLLTFRKMQEQNSKSDTVAEAVLKWCKHQGWVDSDVDDCICEAVFDRETAEIRAEYLCNASNDMEDRYHILARFGSNIIDHFSDKLPKKVDYAV